MSCGAGQLNGYPDTALGVLGQEGDLVGRHLHAHVCRGLQFNHVPIALTIHDQNIWHTQGGSGF